MSQPSQGADASRPAPREIRPEWGVWREPAFIVTAGESGEGKTLDQILAFAGCAVFAAQEGALKPAWSVGRVDLESMGRRVVIHTVEDAIKLARYLVANPVIKGVRILAIVIDDLSLLMKNTYREIAKVNPPTNRKGEVDGFEVWDKVGDRVLEFAQVCRWAGLHVATSTHLRPPETVKDMNTGIFSFFKGGPEMPSRKLTRQLPYFADVVYLTGVEPGRTPWHGVYKCIEGDPQFHMKDRHHIVRGQAPMNLGEILRFAGYILPRPQGLEWMEEVAEGIAQALLGGANHREVTAKAAHNLYYKHNFLPEHISWAVHRDGNDRFLLRKSASTQLAMLGIGATPDAGPLLTAPVAARPLGATLG